MIDFSAQQILKVKKRDGSELDLVPRHVPAKEWRAQVERLRSLDRRRDLYVKRMNDEQSLADARLAFEQEPKNKDLKDLVTSLEKAVAVPIPEAIDNSEYVLACLKEKIENFREEDFESFSLIQQNQILKGILDLEAPSAEEKKSE